MVAVGDRYLSLLVNRCPLFALFTFLHIVLLTKIFFPVTALTLMILIADLEIDLR